MYFWAPVALVHVLVHGQYPRTIVSFLVSACAHYHCVCVYLPLWVADLSVHTHMCTAALCCGQILYKWVYEPHLTIVVGIGLGCSLKKFAHVDTYPG